MCCDDCPLLVNNVNNAHMWGKGANAMDGWVVRGRLQSFGKVRGLATWGSSTLALDWPGRTFMSVQATIHRNKV
jgi:hypothetical protein